MNGRGIRLSVVALFFFACALSWSSLAGGQASRTSQSSRELFQQYVAELQNNPDDEALREKIIQLALTIHPAPAIPEEAHNHFVKGKAYLENAQQAQDVQSAVSAVDEFKKVVALAPWQPQYYYDLGLAYEKLGTLSHSVDDLDLAAADYKLYLVSNPQDASQVQDKILALDAEKQIAARTAAAEAQQQQQAAEEQQREAAKQQELQQKDAQLAQEQAQLQKQQQDEDFIRSLNGAKYVEYIYGYGGKLLGLDNYEIRGDTVVITRTSMDSAETFPISGRQFNENNSAVGYIHRDCLVIRDIGSDGNLISVDGPDWGPTDACPLLAGDDAVAHAAVYPSTRDHTRAVEEAIERDR